MSIEQKKVSEMPLEQRLRATPIQNKFLLLYSIMFEWKYRFDKTPYDSKAAEAEAEKSFLSKMNASNIDNLFQYLGFKNAEDCKKAMETTRRFSIDQNGYIKIK